MKQPPATGNLTGIQKVAVLLMQLETRQAAEVMRQFSEFEADEIAAEIVRLSRVEAQQVEHAINELHDLATAGKPNARGGRDTAASLLEASFGAEKAMTVMNRLSSTMAGMTFEFLESTEPAHIASLLDGELPQTIALVLAHLRPEVASSVLAGFDSSQRPAVVVALAAMGTAVPEAVRVVAEELKKRTGSVMASHEPLQAVGGIQPLVDILNRSNIAVEKEVLSSLDESDPELAEEVRSRMLSFADLVKFDRIDVQRVLRGVDPTTLALALKGVSTDVEDTVRGNISERTRSILDAEISSMGKVRISLVEEARADIVQTIRALESSGEITIKRADKDDYVL
ncbi:flagellar motor switch protein FliG [Paeniglutamicibacter sulfureus]|uniref:flagellar motor switch protein FliG n=1 Tax=Paeniglutamicibacter sulfureus TaxID=43666 RepID=UPI002666DE0A|nr:flagellar motor switch protein FliG [Paeniglutamicibacter sulfureus]MDO2935579.1 flagellar motor switch protein FliG [Paeniglutamicibacter sulfureus]